MPLALLPATPIVSIRPTIRVEVAFTTDPNGPSAATPTWTALKNRVLQIDCSRTSRNSELGAYQAGQATLSLRNADGAFDPVNTAGPYYGLLKPYRPIRIVATWNNVDYPLWQGYVERWPQKWSDPILGLSNIQCVDAFAPLAQIGLGATYNAEVLLDSPTVFYPMGEGSGSTTAANMSATAYRPAQIVHTKKINNTHPAAYAFGQTMAVVGAAAQTGLQFTGTNTSSAGFTPDDGYALNLPLVPVNWAGWTIEFWTQIPNTPDQLGDVFISQDSVNVKAQFGPGSVYPSGFILLQVSNVANVRATNIVVVAPDGGYVVVTFAAVSLGDNLLHHVALTWTANTLNFYIDGNLWGTVPATVPSSSTATTTNVAMVGAAAINARTVPNGPVTDGAPLIGTVSNVAIYPSALTAARIMSHSKAGATAFAGETSGARQARLATYGAWQPAYQRFDVGRSTMAPAAGIAGTSLLNGLQACADAEQGTLTVTADGKIDGRGRDDRMLKTAPTITFGSNTTAGEIPYDLTSLQLDFDPTLVANDVQVGRPNGITAEAADPTSILAYFVRTLPLTLNVDTDDQVQYAANWLLAREKNPALRMQAVSVDAGAIDGSALAALWPSLLGMDLHDRGRMLHVPMGAPVIDLAGFVESIQHQIDASAGTWRISTQLSPVLGQYLILDDPVYGVMDSANCVAF